jgi:arylsulfatase
VLHSWADGKGGQTVEDTGPLTRLRMETIDEEVTSKALEFIDRKHKEQQPFFMWYNTTAMHFRTHRAEKHKGKSGQGFYNDVMVAHDENIGRMLAKLDELGIADNTLVLYSTDNGPHYNAWPDGGITPFRDEKNTNWEGAWRVPAFARWPARFKPGTVLNGIFSHQDWFPTMLAAAGQPEVTERLLNGYQVGDKQFKVHLDGFNMLSYLGGETQESPRRSFFYISDDGDIMAIRMGDWKVVLLEQRAKQLMCWLEPPVKLRAPKLFNLRRDPFERADHSSNTYWDWYIQHAYAIYAMQAIVAEQIEAYKQYPPRQKPAAFNLDEVLRKIQEAGASANH